MGKTIVWGLVIIIVAGAIIRYFLLNNLISSPGFQAALNKKNAELKSIPSLTEQIKNGTITGPWSTTQSSSPSSSYGFKSFQFGADGWLK